MFIFKPEQSGETDLLLGNEHSDLKFTTLDEKMELQTHKAPDGGWTHEALDAITAPVEAWNAHLAAQWIGSSEI